MKRSLFVIFVITVISISAQAKYSGGSGTADNPYRIANATDLLALAADSSDYKKCFILATDIDLGSSSPFTTAVIAPDTEAFIEFQGTAFTGVFDGAGHKIRNLTINANHVINSYLGLFGFVSDGEIKNLGLENISVNGGDDSFAVGGLAGWNEGSGTISHCYSIGTVTGGRGSFGIGGLAGYCWESTSAIVDCYSTCSVTGEQAAGGLVGCDYGAIINCRSTGAVDGVDDISCLLFGLGGLVGITEEGSCIRDCFSTGTVAGGNNTCEIGGLVGSNGCDATIIGCYSTGNVISGSNSQYVGGLAGGNWKNQFTFGTISNCYSTGNVISESNSLHIGGLVGGNVGSISQCYSTGAVTVGDDSANFGGLAGTNCGGSISNCYFLNTSGTDNGKGTPLSDEAMKQQASFVGWDFVGETTNGENDVWWINEGADYPKLAWQRVSIQLTKCTVIAGKKPGTDAISVSGFMNATAEDFNCEGVTVVIIPKEKNVQSEWFPIDSNTFKNGKFSCSITNNAVRASFKYDFKKQKFSFTVKNTMLYGLSCPFDIAIIMGNFNAKATVTEDIANGRKPMPIKLLMGIENSLRVDKSKFTRDKKNGDITRFTIRGGFSVEKIDDTNLVTNPIDITIGSMTFTIPADTFKYIKGKFTCSKVLLLDGEIASASFDFNKCKFSLTIKDTKIPDAAGDADFKLEFGSFDEGATVLLP